MNQKIVWRFTKILYNAERIKKQIKDLVRLIRLSDGVISILKNANDEYGRNEEFTIVLRDSAAMDIVLGKLESFEVEWRQVLEKPWISWSIELESC